LLVSFKGFRFTARLFAPVRLPFGSRSTTHAHEQKHTPAAASTAGVKEKLTKSRQISSLF